MHRRVRVAAAALFLLAGSAADAQRTVLSPNRGLSIGADALGMRFTTSVGGEDVSDNGPGAGLEVGYGQTARLTLFAGASLAQVGGENEYKVRQFDAGLRVFFATTQTKTRPFLEAGFAARQLILDAGDETNGGTVRITATDNGYLLGAGVQHHFRPQFALLAGLRFAPGRFENWKANGETFPDLSTDGLSTSIRIGVRWYPTFRAEQ